MFKLAGDEEVEVALEKSNEEKKIVHLFVFLTLRKMSDVKKLPQHTFRNIRKAMYTCFLFNFFSSKQDHGPNKGTVK